MAKVLVVDDEPLVVKSCRRIFSEEGYEVATSESGWEGLTLACTQDFDVVLTDLKMPDLDGMELIRNLKKERPQMPVIVITGYGTVNSAVEAMKLGAAHYIQKPFTPDEIVEAVAQTLDLEGRSRESSTVSIEADQVRSVLQQAARDANFGSRLMKEGSRVLTGYSLSSEAKAAIVSGDIAWIEKECGELSDEEREWLERRLEMELW